MGLAVTHTDNTPELRKAIRYFLADGRDFKELYQIIFSLGCSESAINKAIFAAEALLTANIEWLEVKYQPERYSILGLPYDRTIE